MDNDKKLLPLLGCIGPALFVVIFIIEGAIRPGYSLSADYVSGLSLGPRAWIQIVSFIICGLGIMLIAFSLYKKPRVSAILFGIAGISLILLGPFVMDPAGTQLADMTVHGIIHSILAVIVFLLMPIMPFVMLRSLKPKCRLWTTSAVFGLIILTADIVFAVTLTAPFAGLTQKLVFTPFMIWAVIIGFASHRRII